MTSKSLRHITHYIVLLIILMAGLLAIVTSGRNLSTRVIILVLISFSYFIWGIIHHSLEKDLHFEIVAEYFIFSLLGLTLVLGVLYYL